MWQHYFTLGQAALPDEMAAAIICREYGWTWHEYDAQPAWFIFVIRSYLRAEADHIKRQNKG